MPVLLRGDQAQAILVNLFGFTVGADDYTAVADAIEANNIGVYFDGNRRVFPGTALIAKYNSVWDAFIFTFNNFQNLEQTALAVHESTHAGMDIQSADITTVDNEALAYTAQWVFARKCGVPRSAHPALPDASLQAIMRAALATANSILDGSASRVFLAKANDLRSAIRQSPMYRDNADAAVICNGVHFRLPATTTNGVDN
jgi:hypothetical protein